MPVVVVDNVPEYMSNNNNDDDDQMLDEFLRRYCSIPDVRMLFLLNSNAVYYAPYADLN